MSAITKIARTAKWLPGFALQRLRRAPFERGGHVVMALADHFEPSFLPETPSEHAPPHEQERRLERWCRSYPGALDRWRDAEGRPWVHTYFSPAEQYSPPLIQRLAEHCHDGWGEVEVHLHHGVEEPDTSESTRRMLTEFRDALAAHGCLSFTEGSDLPRYAFVHGNWTLANSGNGLDCGVDDEMAILAETGCYADMTLPSAPHFAQTAKVNALYECAGPLHHRAPHRAGRDLVVGRSPQVFPLIFQGPLGLFWRRRPGGRTRPYIENGEISSSNPPTLGRFARWLGTGIGVGGRPDWVFIKLHCHGMDPRDEDAMLGPGLTDFLSRLVEGSAGGSAYRLHFCSAREMVNIALAACDGREGDPGMYRDYRFRLGG